MPMHHASVSIEKFNKEKDLPQTMDILGRMQLIQSIGLNVRSADKAYFNKWSSSIIDSEINNKKTFQFFNNCIICFKKTFSSNSLREFISPTLKKLSDENNNKIIHAMDSGGMIKTEHFNIVFEYYNEFIKLNLLYFPPIENYPKKKCKNCLKLTKK